jgi:A/G-specific adenine glycosylase
MPSREPSPLDLAAAGPGRSPDRARDRPVARALLEWFSSEARDLPWRCTGPPGARDPYATLVSEFMLQQTQVARVLERYGPFLHRFPTLASLARAREQSVLAQWSGLGYYRRARLLHAAARRIHRDYGGLVPQDPAALRALPGIGAYTAGAVASICFDRPEPAVDGNVMRVLMRLDGRRGRVDEPGLPAWARDRAISLIGAALDPDRPEPAARNGRVQGGSGAGALNEALMELGATVCTPRAPACGRCPLSGHCMALARGEQSEIPAPKIAAAKANLYCASLVVLDSAGRLLVEQRPAQGLWAGLWQAPTLESPTRPSRTRTADALGLAVRPKPIDRFTHQTTHRVVHFTVYAAEPVPPGPAAQGLARHPRRVWKTPAQAARLPLSNPQRRILAVG